MTSPHAPHAPAAGQRPVSAEGGALTRTILHLWPFIWPHERADLKTRVAWAMALLVIAKVVTMVVPFTFKWATDALAAPQAADAGWWAAVLAAPLAFTLAYGISRVLM
ncbi:MAG: metal ABC transporter permease, partial [Phreatobacter sp.]|nr:metal ABC transporter permease [Phreatobacter sp.]